MSREVETCQLNVSGPGNRVLWEHVASVRYLNLTIEGENNVIEFDARTVLNDVTIVIRGGGNRVVLGPSRLRECGLAVLGSDNSVVVGRTGSYQSLSVLCEDSGNGVRIGDGTEVAGATELVVMERTRILVGDGCLFSGRIRLRTGDSHSVVDLQGRRVNPSRDIVIGNHVWVGSDVTMLKGSGIADSSVVGAAAVVTKRFDRPNCAIAGNPAKVVREGIDWRVERLPSE